ncbi:MAG: orotate phosphoribosyltransferase [Pelagibacterales bacterium]
MKKEEIVDILEKTGAIQHGHFILSSGKRSAIYCQCAKLFIYPEIAEKICSELAIKVINEIKLDIDYIVAPAMGGVLVGYELARQLKTKSVFYERVNGTFKLRRGFEIESNAKVVLVEDVITTGKSANECIIELNKIGVNLLATVCLIDRTNNESVIKDPISIHRLDIPIYDEDSLPDELKSIRPIKPGSRDI